MPDTHFICLPCRVYQRDNDQCCQCGQDMQPGTLCRCCGESKSATGADECVACLADEVRLDSSTLDGMIDPLRGEVLAHMRANTEPTYDKGFMTRRQAGAL